MRFLEKIEKLHAAFPNLALCRDATWKKLTTAGVGNNIPVIADPANDLSLSKLLKYCRQNDIPVFILGAGSNTIGSDEAYQGIIIKLCKNDFIRIKISHKHVTVGAGVSLIDFLTACANAGLGGFPSLAAIPGTVGGAIRMNASARGIAICDIVDDVCGFDLEGNTWCALGKEISWRYRSVSIPENIVITAAICRLNKVSEKEELKKIREEFKWRRTHFPAGKSAGCVFRNPSPELSAGKLIDISGAKKLSNKNAFVSSKHANYIINTGDSREKDYMDIMLKVKQHVYDNSGIYLSPEVCFANHKSKEKLNSTPYVLKIAVLKGGDSSERKISLLSGSYVASALRTAGYRVAEIDIKKPEITDEIRNSDLVFPVLHGGFGENGEIQKVLEDAGIPFVGCDHNTSSIVIDKIKSKKIMMEKGIPTPAYGILTKDNKSLPENLNFPVVIKPPAEGSTVGVSIVYNNKKWEKALKYAFSFSNDKVLVESYIKGTEITVGVLDSKALPVIEICYPGKMYDFDAKYTHHLGKTMYLCPPRSVPLKIQKKAQKIALEFYEAVEARDMLRIDMIVGDDDNSINVLEANNIPGFTDSSLLPKAASAAGISFIELCAKLVQMAWRRKK